MRKHIVGASIIAVTAVVGALLGAAAASAAPSSKPIPNSTPGWLSHGKSLGAASANAPVNARVYLAPNGGLSRDLAPSVEGIRTVLQLRGKYATPQKSLTDPMKYVDLAYYNKAFGKP